MDDATIALIVAGASLGLSIINTVRQVRRDRATDRPRLVVSCEGNIRGDDDDVPFSLVVRVANAGFRPAQVVRVRFALDPSATGFGRSALELPQVEPGTALPTLVGENESITFEYDASTFDDRRGVRLVEVQDALRNTYHASVPRVRRAP